MRVSSTDVLVCAQKTADNTIQATLLRCPTSGAIQHVVTLPLPECTGTPRMLVSYDGGNGKSVIFYVSGADVYALTLTVVGNTITPGTPQLLGTTTKVPIDFAVSKFRLGGTDMFSDCTGKYIMPKQAGVSYNTGTHLYVYDIDSNGIVTVGAPQIAKVMNTLNGNSCITYKSNKVYITGIELITNTVGNRYGRILEIDITGTTMKMKEFDPFPRIGPVDAYANCYSNSKYAAFIPSDNLEDDIFMIQQNFQTDYQTTRGFFGNIADYVVDTSEFLNYLGIVIDGIKDGHMRVQYASKLIKGLWANLVPGRIYQVSNNGGALAAGSITTMNIGVAVNATDLLFFGATPIN